MYDGLVTEFNAIHPSKLVTKLTAIQKFAKLIVKSPVLTITILLLTIIK